MIQVEKDSVGARAGFQMGDVLVSMEGTPLSDREVGELAQRGIGAVAGSRHEAGGLFIQEVDGTQGGSVRHDRFQLSFQQALGVEVRVRALLDVVEHLQQHVGLLEAVHHGLPVLVFDAEAIEGCSGPNIIKVAGLPMRQAFALASACAAIIAPDSAFVHLAAALDVPCVALYGPIDGAVRTKHYPRCTFLDVRQRLQCLPCWRNEQITCRLTNMRSSVCMAEISIHEITSAVNEVLRGRTIA